MQQKKPRKKVIYIPELIPSLLPLILTITVSDDWEVVFGQSISLEQVLSLWKTFDIFPEELIDRVGQELAGSARTEDASDANLKPDAALIADHYLTDLKQRRLGEDLLDELGFEDDLYEEEDDEDEELGDLDRIESIDDLDELDDLDDADEMDFDDLLDADDPLLLAADYILLHLSGATPLTLRYDLDLSSHENLIPIRIPQTPNGIAAIEVLPAIVEAPGAARTIDDWSRDWNLQTIHLEYDAVGGAVERMRVPVEIEAWRLVREHNATANTIDMLAREMLGMEFGPLTQLDRLAPPRRGEIGRDLAENTLGDPRFRPFADYLPGNEADAIWRSLRQDPAPLEGPDPETPPQRVLLAGTPHLVDLWKERLYEASQGKLIPDAWRLWDLGAVREEELKEVVKRGPYDLVMELLVGPAEDRQQLLDVLIPHIRSRGHVWVHTLNVASTVIVQVVPEDLCAVGFGGLPSLSGRPLVELAKPNNSDASDLLRAAGMARILGLEPHEVADEPGGIGARMLATAVNSTAFLVREGIVTSTSEADSLAKRVLLMHESPFALADVVGLDSIEGALVGLQAFLGEERYRVCPLLTLRIESGAIGKATGNGFYP